MRGCGGLVATWWVGPNCVTPISLIRLKLNLYNPTGTAQECTHKDFLFPMHKTRKRSPINGLIKIPLPAPDSYSTETEPKMLPFFPNTNYQVHSGLCFSRAWWPVVPNFCSRLARKTFAFHTNHMLGTLDFSVSEHWAPFKFAQSTALHRNCKEIKVWRNDLLWHNSKWSTISDWLSIPVPHYVWFRVATHMTPKHCPATLHHSLIGELWAKHWCCWYKEYHYTEIHIPRRLVVQSSQTTTISYGRLR